MARRDTRKNTRTVSGGPGKSKNAKRKADGSAPTSSRNKRPTTALIIPAVDTNSRSIPNPPSPVGSNKPSDSVRGSGGIHPRDSDDLERDDTHILSASDMSESVSPGQAGSPPELGTKGDKVFIDGLHVTKEAYEKTLRAVKKVRDTASDCISSHVAPCYKGQHATFAGSRCQLCAYLNNEKPDGDENHFDDILHEGKVAGIRYDLKADKRAAVLLKKFLRSAGVHSAELARLQSYHTDPRFLSVIDQWVETKPDILEEFAYVEPLRYYKANRNIKVIDIALLEACADKKLEDQKKSWY